MKLRLVQVIVEPVFVVEDTGGNLSPLHAHIRQEDGSPLALRSEVKPSEWPTYPAGEFVEAQAALQKELLRVANLGSRSSSAGAQS